MSSSRTLFAGLLIVGLSAGCATRAPLTDTGGGDLPDAWLLKGRLALANGRDGGSGQLTWRNLGADRAELRFHGALGQGSWRLSLAPEAAHLRLADGSEFAARDVDTLLRQHTRIRVPVDSLKYWLVGKAASGRVAGSELGADGRLESLRQSGWRVEFQGYREYTGTTLPRKIVATRDGNEVRLIVTSFEPLVAITGAIP